MRIINTKITTYHVTKLDMKWNMKWYIFKEIGWLMNWIPGFHICFYSGKILVGQLPPCPRRLYRPWLHRDVRDLSSPVFTFYSPQFLVLRVSWLMTQSRPGCKALLQPWEYHEMQKVGYPWLVLLCSVAGSQSTVRPVKSRKLRNRFLH